MTDLKRCPFCRSIEVTHAHSYKSEEDLNNNKPVYSILCYGCKIMIDGYSTPEEAAAAWNTRATPDTSVNDELLAVLKFYADETRYFGTVNEDENGTKMEWPIYQDNGQRARAAIANYEAAQREN